VTKYLKVEIEGKYVGQDVTVYQPLDDEEYSEKELEEWAQDLVNNEFTWGHSVVDEEDVPEDER
jgi:hypothetical protein